ncbi:phage tail protein [Wolbachia endosymbiont (group A) of Philonthus cognatus]|uniref:phage tail protein n=1 Tax=Wolbachia endosymbiont (group A) of Philonthus cognatus TaxID=2954046 RepID=UPI001BC24A81|nr:phage tail protein [Wolbachia endosymbiont (group A) of Philonthus cognatus]MBR9984184.1 phage tail protein [Wolbachia endosymbiont of Homalodisca vitripennis]MCJ7454210.1 phage tail protein [Wolbachia endosymbiont of Homalodisca vitripennis]MCJ7476517.1 phage tail protein [Wolbachia endosymbiont of Homalodisca vitripennis]
MLLGKCKLELTSLRYIKEERWYTIECIEKTSLQNIGSGIECIDLTGVIYPRYQSNGLEQLKNIRDTKEPHVLVDNSGNVLGNFVITNVEEKQILFFPDGKPRKVEFILKLKSYSK